MLALEHGRALAPLTTLRLGGPAAHFVRAQDRDVLADAVAWAAQNAQPLHVLGGGSNLVIADEGVPGLVLQIATRGTELTREGAHALVTAQAGEVWDDVVEFAVRERLAGIECLSGIPGSTGATPIQNVGAYGQEVSEVIDAVEVLERASGAVSWLRADECAFGYRDSRFKREPERFVVLAVRFRLRTDGMPNVRYAELARAIDASPPSLREVQQTVRALRASKGMLVDESFVPSAGSFFMNPIVSVDELELVIDRALARGLIRTREELPRFPAAEQRVKLAAGWLIERAGIQRGLRRGGVGVSSRHALALVHHGGGTTRELLALARELQDQVHLRFGVSLHPEPVHWPLVE